MMIRQFRCSEINILFWNQDFYRSFKDIIHLYNEQKIESSFKDVWSILEEKFSVPINQTECKKFLAVSKSLFYEANAERNVIKLFIALAVVHALKQDIHIFFELETLSKPLLDVVKNLLSSTHFSFGLVAGAPYGESKTISQYEEAVNHNDEKVILKTMNQLKSSSNCFELIDCTWGLFFRFIFLAEKSFLSEYLENASYEDVEIALYSLRYNIKDVLEKYNYSDKTYPFLRGLSYLFDFGDILIENQKIFPDFSDLLNDFIIAKPDLLPTLLNYLCVKNKKSFNFTLGLNTAKNNQNFAFYIENIDFSIDSLNYFSIGLMSISQPKVSFISKASFLLEKTLNNVSPTHINENLGCLNLLMNYFSLISASKNIYLHKLKQYSDEITNLQNSWNTENLTKSWVELFYCSLANYFLKFQYTEKELNDNVSVLYDKRNYLEYDTYSIDLIRKILLNPDEFDDVELIHLQEKQTYNLASGSVK